MICVRIRRRLASLIHFCDAQMHMLTCGYVAYSFRLETMSFVEKVLLIGIVFPDADHFSCSSEHMQQSIIIFGHCNRIKMV